MSLPPKTLLIPGPWVVRGNTVLDANGKTIAVCFARNATAHAYWIAEIPKLANATDHGIDDAEDTIAELKFRVAELERENARFHETNEENDQSAIGELEYENESLRSRVEFLEARVKLLENKAVTGK
jgi:FtsZ-binding cell division protein ZapB